MGDGLVVGRLLSSLLELALRAAISTARSSYGEIFLSIAGTPPSPSLLPVFCATAESHRPFASMVIIVVLFADKASRHAISSDIGCCSGYSARREYLRGVEGRLRHPSLVKRKREWLDPWILDLSQKYISIQRGKWESREVSLILTPIITPIAPQPKQRAHSRVLIKPHIAVVS